MKVVEYNSLGLKWPINVPETVDEAAQKAGGEAKVVEIFNDHVVYHNTLSGIRADFVDAVAQATGIARKTKVVGKTKGENPEDILAPAESESEYIERVCAERGHDVSAFAHLQQAVLEKNPFDATARERSAPKPKTPTKGDYALADKVIEAGADKLAAVVSMLASKVGHEVGTDRDSVARAIMENRRAEEAALAEKQAASLLG